MFGESLSSDMVEMLPPVSVAVAISWTSFGGWKATTRKAMTQTTLTTHVAYAPAIVDCSRRCRNADSCVEVTLRPASVTAMLTR